MIKNKSFSLLDNSRFYILVSTVLLSIFVVSYFRIQIVSDQLYFIRIQQVFGLLGVLYWYIALIISPLGYILGKKKIEHLEFMRRAIGVSAFYFVLLHGSIALWGQLGGMGQIKFLPELFVWSILAGTISFVVLLIMSLTSFDWVVKLMTYRRWKLLHRLVYIAGVLAIVHIWSVGTHLAYRNIQIIAFVSLVILIGLEMYRFVSIINKKYLHLEKTESFVLFLSAWATMSLLVLIIPALIDNYHGSHESHESITAFSETIG